MPASTASQSRAFSLPPAIAKKHRVCGPKSAKFHRERDLEGLLLVGCGANRAMFLHRQRGQFPFTGTREPHNFLQPSKNGTPSSD